MKSEHRHDLETNMLARQLAEGIKHAKPHTSTITTTLLIAACLVVGLLYFQKSSASHQEEAWDAYNLAIENPRSDSLDELKQAAEQNAGSTMADLADITWADGQLLTATRQFFQFRTIANESLTKAEGAYKSLLKSADKRAIQDRAHFGLGRVYEMRNELDKACEHYNSVKGGFAALAMARTEELQQEQVIEATAWLATAELPARPSPNGAGAGGTAPEFQVDSLDAPLSDEDAEMSDFLDSLVPEDSDEPRYGPAQETGEEASPVETAEESADSEAEAAAETPSE